MLFPSIDKILNLVDSKYELVHIVAKRSKEMAKNGHYQLPDEEYDSVKPIGRALEEVEKGLIVIKKD